MPEVSTPKVIKHKRTFLDFFPVPEFLLISTAGISITDHHVRFTEFKKGKYRGELELTHYATAEIPHGLIESGAIKNAEPVIPVVKEIGRKYGVKYTRATLPEEKAYVFTTTIARVPDDGLRDAVAFIIEENVPVELATSVFDFEIIPSGTDAKEVKVAVSVLPTQVVENYSAIFRGAGMIPISFDIESQAIARAVIPAGDMSPYLIINLSTYNTGFYVAEEEVVQFSSTIANGAIGGAEAAKQLRDEMRKIFSFWNMRVDKNGVPQKRIEKIIITGAEATNEAFLKEVMTGIEIPYEIGNVWVNTTEHKENIPNIAFKDSLTYTAAIGLTLPNRHGQKKNV